MGRYGSLAFRVYPTRESWHLYPQAFHHFLTISGRPWYGQNKKTQKSTKSTKGRNGNRFNEKCLFVNFEQCSCTKYQPSPLLRFFKIHFIVSNRCQCWQNEDTLPIQCPKCLWISVTNRRETVTESNNDDLFTISNVLSIFEIFSPGNTLNFAFVWLDCREKSGKLNFYIKQ